MKGPRRGPPLPRPRPAPPRRPPAPANEDLSSRVVALDRRPYPEYRRLIGRHPMGEFTLVIDRVHADPFAGPARVRVVVDRGKAGLPAELASTPLRRVALEDALARTAATMLDELFGRAATPPGAGRLAMEPPGPAILERSCCRVTEDTIELRLLVDLPASGGRILGFEAEVLLRETLRRLATSALLFSARRIARAREHVAIAEDHAALQASLRTRGWVSFLADGTALPASRGGEIAIATQGELRSVAELAGGQRMAGLAIPAGVTVLVGATAGAASALLAGIAAGRFPHPADDPRSRIVTERETASIRAEPGRSLRRVDLSGWVTTETFGSAGDVSAEQAGAFLSQAAAAVEAIEAGARVLLVDEEHAAAAFLARDARMQRLLPARRAGTVPLAARARALYDRLGVSTVITTSSVGDLLPAAHTVLRVGDAGEVEDVTTQARELVRATAGPAPEPLAELQQPGRREPVPPDRPAGTKVRTGLAGAGGLRVGDETVDLSAIAATLERGQMLTLAALAGEAQARMEPGRSMAELLDVLEREAAEQGLDALDPPVAYELTMVGRQEIAAMLGRWRSLRIRRPDR